MSGKLREHLTYANVMATIAVFLALGGTAVAIDGSLPGQNTVGSADIINGEVQTADIRDANLTTADIRADAVTTGKIGDGEVRSVDVLDDSLQSIDVSDDSLTSQDLADNAVGTLELQGALVFDSRDGAIDDPVGGGASEVILLSPQGHQVIGRCLEDPADTVTATIVVKSVGVPRTTAVDNNGAPNGATVTDLAHGVEANLVELGPTALTTWQTGQYAVTSFLTASPALSFPGFNGNVAVATNFGDADCRFQATALGGALGPGS